jgi:glycosyltransferase involved in cell wall biosynthesis
MTEFGMLCPALPYADVSIPVPPSIVEEWVYAINQVMNDNDIRERFIGNGLRRVRDFDKSEILAEWKKNIDGLH